MKELLIAVDSGKSSTKALMKINGKIEKFLFRTKVQEITDLGVEITPNSYVVEFQGKSYLVGDMVSESSCNFQITKNTIEHQLSIYISICKFLDKTEALKYGLPKIHLALNVPLNIYKNNTLKKQYQSFMQNNGEIISMKVNGTAYAFRISSLLVLPEAMGPLYYRTNDFRKKVTVIDIGSLNINYCTFNNLVPELNSMNISNSGINVLRAKIAEKLTERYGTLVTDDDVEEILKNGGYLYISAIKKTESKEIVEKLINNHVSEIFNYARSRGLTFNNSSTIFVGGGTLLLKNYIISQYPLAIIEEDCLFSNCLSFLNILEVKNAN